MLDSHWPPSHRRRRGGRIPRNRVSSQQPESMTGADRRKGRRDVFKCERASDETKTETSEDEFLLPKKEEKVTYSPSVDYHSPPSDLRRRGGCVRRSRVSSQQPERTTGADGRVATREGRCDVSKSKRASDETEMETGTSEDEFVLPKKKKKEEAEGPRRRESKRRKGERTTGDKEEGKSGKSVSKPAVKVPSKNKRGSSEGMSILLWQLQLQSLLASCACQALLW